MQQHYHEEPPVRMAYSSIFGFFDAYPLAAALELTASLVDTACNTKHWKKDGCNLLFFMRHLQELCMAALVIHYEGGERLEAVLTMPESGMPDTTQHTDYVNPRYMGNPWDCFPRHLSARQYHNPYKVFKKAGADMQELEWRRALRLLLEYALSKDSIEGAYTLYELLRMRRRLLQVVEASHLILVRTMVVHKNVAATEE